MSFQEAVRPFTTGKGKRVALLVHGYRGSPYDFRECAAFLAQNGYRVIVPLLPGHGTSKDDLRMTRWWDWFQAAKDQLVEVLSQDYEEVFLVGFSLGGGIALSLAAEFEGVDGVVTICTPFGIPRPISFLIRYFSKFLPGVNSTWSTDISLRTDPILQEMRRRYNKTILPCVFSVGAFFNDVRKKIAHVTRPTLIIQSQRDRVVSPKDAQKIYDRLPGPQKWIEYLPNSDHLALKDVDKEKVFNSIVRFMQNQL